MKKWWSDNRFVVEIFVLWRFVLFLAASIAPGWYTLQTRFMGSIPWANFDGVHYLVIATQGYQQYEQAFFPIYPMLIAGIKQITLLSAEYSALIISHTAFFFGLVELYALAKSVTSERAAKWALLFLITFPLSFFFAAAYSESIYFFLAVSCLLALHRGKYSNAVVFCALASATRVFGVALLVPIVWKLIGEKKLGPAIVACIVGSSGLMAYMVFLAHTTGDPLAFIHVQPHFGAERSDGTLIFLPQVLWRYGKIAITASKSTFQYYVAMGELLSFLLGGILILRGYANRTLRPMLSYAGIVLLLPTFSGTLSSLPRYLLSAFPLFIVPAMGDNIWMQRLSVVLGICLEIVGMTLFLQGYFIA
jgi:hypothetical protein